MSKLDENIKEEESLQIEENIYGEWHCIYFSDDKTISKDDVKRLYNELKKIYKEKSFRLVVWRTVSKRQILEGKLF